MLGIYDMQLKSICLGVFLFEVKGVVLFFTIVLKKWCFPVFLVVEFGVFMKWNYALCVCLLNYNSSAY
jgi:hypothetical protein